MAQRFTFDLQRRVSRARRRFRRRFTDAGLVVLVGMTITAMLGIDTEQSLAYQAFAFLLALLLMSILFVPFFRAKLSTQLGLPRFGSVGVPFRAQVIVSNHDRRAQRGLTVFLDLRDPFQTWEEYLDYHRSKRRPRSFRLGRPPRRRPRALLEPGPLPTIPPGRSAQVDLEVTPLRRGRLRFSGATVARPDPLNLTRSLRPLRAEQSLVILPRRYPLPPVALPGTLKYQQGGVALASSVGESQEYVFLREYRRGDPLRHVHWKSWARLGKPVVKEFQDEFFVRHALVLDTFPGLDDEEIFEEAVSIAASFAYTIQTQESLLDLMFVGTDAFCFTAGRGLAEVDQILEVLASVVVCRGEQFEKLERLVLEHTGSLSGCILVLQTWDAPRQRLVRQLQVAGVPLLILVVGRAGHEIIPGAEVSAEKFKVLRVGQIAEDLARL